jgi:hypothetical protein
LSLDSKSLRLAIAAVFAFFSFLVAFFIVSDRLGGWPLGYVVAFAIATMIFLAVLAIAPRLVAKSGTSPSRERARPPLPQPTTSVQAPVHEDVPVGVRVGQESRAANMVKEKPQARLDEPPPNKADRFVPPPPEIETIFDDIVEVNSGRGGCWDLELPLEVGDTLRGTLREVDGYEFGWMILPGEEFAAFLNGDNPDNVEGEENVRAASIEWQLTEKGPWHLVIEAYGKQYTREVRVLLRRIH